jgi:AraC-like DNA-binding protein
MIYERPVIQILETLDAFFDLILPRKCNVSPDIDWRAKKLTEFIDTHAGKVRWNLDDVCQQLGLPMSGRQARRLFKVSTGMGIREYGRNRRLACAAEQLRVTNASVKAIAADVGYRRTSEFARSFKELFCLSPMEFRRVWRQREFAI